MKYLIVLLVLLLVAPLGMGQQYLPENAKLVKTFTTYISTSDDTTGYITVPVTNVLNAREVGIIAVATDSVHADLYFLGRNLDASSVWTASLTYANSVTSAGFYADSLSTLGANYTTTSATLPYIKVIMLKDATKNVLAGCLDFKIGTVFKNTAQQGNTAGRTLKYFLFWRY
jgi:hypothetical protein